MQDLTNPCMRCAAWCRLFYRVLTDNIEELLPKVYMPTVSKYCQTYSLMFRSLPRGMFISMEDRGARLSATCSSTLVSVHCKALCRVCLCIANPTAGLCRPHKCLHCRLYQCAGDSSHWSLCGGVSVCSWGE